MGLSSQLNNLATSNSLSSLKRSWFKLMNSFIPGSSSITFYHQVNDPYSFLLLIAMRRFLEDFKVNLKIELILDMEQANAEWPVAKWRDYALQDAERLALFHDLQFRHRIEFPSDENAFVATALLLKHQQRPKLLHMLAEVTGALWGTSTTTFESCVNRYGSLTADKASKIITANNSKLKRCGQYKSAMLYYAGEWYWGLDRLGHLAERLCSEGKQRDTGEIADYQRQYRHILQSYTSLRARPKQVHPLDFYFSFADPYSYLVAERIFKLTELYKIPLNLKPVITSTNRLDKQQKAQRRYFLQDAKREAGRYEIAFGNLCDPAAAAIANCMALFAYAEQENQAQNFSLRALTAIWAKGADLSHSSAIKKLLSKTGLSWEKAQPYLQDFDWQSKTGQNLKGLQQLGIYATPGFQYDELRCWGQDRLWALEQAILTTNNSNKADKTNHQDGK